MHLKLPVGVQWFVMCIFLLLRFYDFSKGIVYIYKVFLKRLRPLFLYLTNEYVQIFNNY